MIAEESHWVATCRGCGTRAEIAPVQFVVELGHALLLDGVIEINWKERSLAEALARAHGWREHAGDPTGLCPLCASREVPHAVAK